MLALSSRSSARRIASLIDRRKLLKRNGFEATCLVIIDSKRNNSMYANPWLEYVFESQPVQLAEQVVTQFHDISGLPWWSSIALSTMTVRFLATFPLAIYSEIILARLANLEKEAAEINEILKEEVVRAKHTMNLTEKEALRLYKINLNKQVQKLIVRENCHPLKAKLLPFVQIPLWISLSFGLRDISIKALHGDYNYLSMTSEGFFWIQNLTMPDSFLIFPVLSAILNLINLELYSLRTDKPPSRFMSIVNKCARLGCIVVIPVGLVVPGSTSFYWFCSSLTALCQNLILMSPNFKRAVRIPITRKENPNPYMTIKQNFMKKYFKRGNATEKT